MPTARMDPGRDSEDTSVCFSGEDIRRILLIEKCDDNGDLVLTSSAKVLEGLFNPFPGNPTDLAVGVYDST
jgi:hypothetical protein